MKRLVRGALLGTLCAAPLGASAEELPAPELPPAAPSDAQLEARVKELEEYTTALGEALAQQELSLSSDQPSLRFYGFADVGLIRVYPSKDHPLKAVAPAGGTFILGNLNLYGAANLTHGISSLFEVRFSYLPNGAFDQGGQQLSTIVSDYNDWYRPVSWGGIVLERAHVDYSYSSYLNLRLGHWKTPYGVWNVDHGSPTLISAGKPYPVGAAIFPEHQVGLELFGALLFGDTTLGYHLTLSNGRGELDQFDYDKNKAVGGRLLVSTHAVGSLTAGLSLYAGLATQAVTLGASAGPNPKLKPISHDQYDEFAVAADLVWEWMNVRLQGEVIAGQVKYRDNARRRLSTVVGGPTGLVPDHVNWGAYGLLGYRLPWFGVMPHFIAEYSDRGYGRGILLGPTDIGGRGVRVSAGLNVRPIPSLVLKFAYQYTWLFDGAVDGKLPMVIAQVAWAF